MSVLLFKSQHCYNSEWVHAMCGGGIINDRDLWDRQSMVAPVKRLFKLSACVATVAKEQGTLVDPEPVST